MMNKGVLELKGLLFFCFYRKMAQNILKKRMSKSIDATGSAANPWYLDFYLPNGGSDDKVHLFLQDKEQPTFKNCGVVKELKKDYSDLDMSPCLGVKVLNGDCYLLEPTTFLSNLVKVDHEGLTMSKAGWVELKEDTPSEDFIDMFIEGFSKVTRHLGKIKKVQNKKRKNEESSEGIQSKTLKESEAPLVGNNSRVSEQENLLLVSLDAQEVGDTCVGTTPATAVVVDSASVAVIDSVGQLNEKDMDKQVAKTSKSGLDGYVGIEHYFKFGVQFTQLIPVDQCNLAPDPYKCRPLSDMYVKYLLRQFAGHSRPVSNAADLMLYDPMTKIPLKENEVQGDKLATYHYWILSGQHSIIAARAFLRNKSTKYISRKEFYKFRTARIVVDAPKEVAVRISRMENIETQTAMKTQPYLEVLKHGRGQWLAYSRPAKPKPGVPVGHESRKLWDVSSTYFLCIA